MREPSGYEGEPPGKLAWGGPAALLYSYFTAISSKGLAIMALRSPD
ncbi:hypothetical protein [Oscillatoria sp. HE19RPO]|nr:hypothetical protein [Oscillatoria sp. HE19RPO]